MKGFVKKTLSGWEPADEQAVEMHHKHPKEMILRAEIVQPRNYRHHCLFMALMDLTYQNQETYTDAWTFRTAIALEAGHVRQFVNLDGEICFVPLRYSYDDIPDEQDAGVAFGHALAVCAKILRMNAPALEAEVSKYAVQHYGLAA